MKIHFTFWVTLHEVVAVMYVDDERVAKLQVDHDKWELFKRAQSTATFRQKYD